MAIVLFCKGKQFIDNPKNEEGDSVWVFLYFIQTDKFHCVVLMDLASVDILGHFYKSGSVEIRVQV